MTYRAARSIKLPRIDAEPRMRPEEGDADELVSHATFERTRYANPDLSGRDLAGLTLSECELTGATMDDTDLTSARLIDTRIRQLHAPRFSAPRGTLRNVRVEGSRIGAWDLFDAGLQSVVVTDSKLGLVDLRAAAVRDVQFRGCIIDELDLGDAKLTRVAFDDCRVAAIDTHRATLTDVDFRGLDIGLVRNPDGMRGATISGHQAVALAGLFAAHLGIQVDG